jgi:tetratricopeptide (TPR) repeat protein
MTLSTTIVVRSGAPVAAGSLAGMPVVVVDGDAPLLPIVAAITTDITVLVDAGLVLPDGWLDDLIAPFSDPLVAVAGPVFNDGGPAQRVSLEVADVEDGEGRTAAEAAIRAAASAWRLDHDGLVHAAMRLDPWCFAVRTDAARTDAVRTDAARTDTARTDAARTDAARCDDDAARTDGAALDELCRQVVMRGHEVVVVEQVYVHRHGASTVERTIADEIHQLVDVAQRGRKGPLLSAALIVKNEEDNLPRCLASLSGLVDEVVVYDTGSVDRTVEIARSAGAVVIEGYWDDDFSRARNEAISHCAGEWILSIDADEIATGDPATVRTALEVNWGVDVLTVQITNMLGGSTGTRAGLDHQGPRLLRRSRCRWRLRLHEQPFTPAGEPPMRGGRMSHLRLLHTGYTDSAADARDKIARNIRVAEEGLAELVDPEPGELVANLVNLGRSYTWAGRNDDALSCYRRAIGIDGPSGYRRTALTHGFEALMALGRLDEADEWLALLREASSEASVVPRYLEGLLVFRRGDVAGALELFEGIDAIADDDGTARGPDFVAKVKGMAHLANRDWSAALEALMLAATSGSAPAWGPMAIAAANATADLGVVAALVSDRTLMAACTEVVTCLPTLAPPFLEALWERFPGDARLLGAAARLGPALGLGRALDWSARLRSAGVVERCPLRAMVGSAATPAMERLRAAAILESAFGEVQSPAVVADLVTLLGGVDGDRMGAELSELCPRLGALVAERFAPSPA